MHRSILASVVAGAALLHSSAAGAATRFDMTFTGLTSNMVWSPASWATGTGFIEVEGFMGLGVEVFGGADLSRTVVNFKVELAGGMFDAGVTAGGHPKLTLLNGVASNFEFYGYRFSPATALYSPLAPGSFQLVTKDAIYTGLYTLTRYEPPPSSKPPITVAPDPVSAAPEPATWVSLIVGFFGLGAMVRRARRGGALA